MGVGKDYQFAVPVATFLTEQWNTIKTNLAAKNAQVCVGGFILATTSYGLSLNRMPPLAVPPKKVVP